MERLFDSSKIKMFDHRELNGKTLKITTIENDAGILTSGKDIKTGNLYVLSYIEKKSCSGK